MKKVTLYTKLNCHLCEEAYRMLLELTSDITLEIDLIDITHEHNRNIRATYAERIPVIACNHIDLDLDWPFTLEDIRAYLAV